MLSSSGDRDQIPLSGSGASPQRNHRCCVFPVAHVRNREDTDRMSLLCLAQVGEICMQSTGPVKEDSG